MKYLLINLWLAFMPQDQGCLKIDIILLGDLSGSVDGNEYFVADAFDAFVDRFTLSENTIKIGIMIFESEPHVLAHLTTNKQILKDGINYIRNNNLSGNSRLGIAINQAWYEFLNNGRTGVRKMLIIVSDGAIDESDYTLAILRNIRATMDIDVCGIYIDTYGGDQDYMIKISDLNCYVSTGYNQLVQELERLDMCI